MSLSDRLKTLETLQQAGGLRLMSEDGRCTLIAARDVLAVAVEFMEAMAASTLGEVPIAVGTLRAFAHSRPECLDGSFWQGCRSYARGRLGLPVDDAERDGAVEEVMHDV